MAPEGFATLDPSGRPHHRPYEALNASERSRANKL